MARNTRSHLVAWEPGLVVKLLLLDILKRLFGNQLPKCPNWGCRGVLFWQEYENEARRGRRYCCSHCGKEIDEDNHG